ncbi:DUF4270 domain-containing protein [uncultured Aquimarina sp.]|uniref:DUF4270 domain-containing protein n=1 Tax=uncultured Aquimarina sp. TaxID=575652 RepID=UPI00260BBC8A|nr:DUF4270 domain-containing protein [uncultured Aquimarina sp.]
MNLKNVLIKITAIVAVVFTVVSCDDDFNSVGSEVIGDVNFEDNQYAAIPLGYSKRFEKVQTSNLPNYLIGVYNDPVYGQSTYNVLSQVLPSRLDPVFGDNPVLDSVVLSLPYFSELTETNTDDEGEVTNTYELDSVYGSQNIRLSVYQSDYFLRNFGVGDEAEERQIYYSNDIESFGPIIENKLLFSVDNYAPSANELRLVSEDDDSDGNDDPQVTRLAPGLRLALISDDAAAEATALNPDPDNDPSTDNTRTGNQELIDYFTGLFLDKEGSIELSNANNFNNYFRGIYFKTEAITQDGSLIFFDITSANITLHYSFDTEVADTDDIDDDGDTTELITVRDEGNLPLTFLNNIVNGIDFDFSTTISGELDDQDMVNGEENLYLKGGEGSYAVLDFFNGNVTNENGESENELDFLKRQDWLINEASMKIYINQDEVVSGDAEPERVYVFNLETGVVLIDYLVDSSSNTTNPVQSVTNHLGRISRDSDEKGEFYKIRLTQHIINILNDDTDNVKLGLSVSQNVNISANAEGFIPANTDEEIIPFSSIISHEGTILYGNGTNVPEEKRLKLDIFYTESKSN